jgi:dTDP-4-amino-4,6-dideoxygalactose transaminase
MKNIPFNKPYTTEQDLLYIKEALNTTNLSGDGPYTKKCHIWIEKNAPTEQALLTHSCTAALEMSALLLDIEPGDEVIMPSYTFVSTANAFVLRGAIPVFVDIRPDTLNIDEKLIEEAITPRTRAIIPVHYAGVSCEMDTINIIAKKHNLAVIEDAAQGVQSFYKGKMLGALGDFGCYSFHGTKNVVAGEGGALLVNNPQYAKAAEIIREKGTDRAQFFKGQVDKYTWQSLGSSYLPSELTAAFLLSQLEQSEMITKGRLGIWDNYHNALEELEQKELIRRPHIPVDCQHNAHMYYLLLRPDIDRDTVLANFREKGISCTYHYVPLHSSPAGLKFGKIMGDLPYTDKLSSSLIRLPLWMGISQEEQEYIIKSTKEIIAS